MGITQQEALELFNSDDLIGIGMAANEVRRAKTDPRVATYQIDRNINYTNFCTEYCSFCAFYRPLGAKDGYILPLESIYEKIEEMIELGGTGVLMQGGLHPDLRIEFYENMLRSIKQKFPQIHLHCFSAPEIGCIAEVSGLSVRDTIARLRDAGLDSIPGGGAEILDDEIRAKISRLKCRSDEWVSMHRDAHALGMRTTATMMFGCGEEYRHRVNHLETHSPHSGRYRRVHRFHSVDFRAGKYAARKENSRGHGVRLSEDAGDQPPVSRQHRSHSVQLADAGDQDLPGRVAIWRGRCGQHPDRRKRGVRRRRAQPHQRSRAAPDYFRRWLHSRTARHALSFLLAEAVVCPPQPQMQKSRRDAGATKSARG